VLPAALLFHGPRGIGKQRLALWLAQLTVCVRPTSEPCGVCAPCRMAVGLEHPDVHWFYPLPRPKGVAGDRLADALEEARLDELAALREQPLHPSHTDDVRGLYVGTVKSIRAKAHMRPVMARGPVFVIGEAESLVPQEASPEAANALLKLLEEPPGASRFILTTSEAGLLPATIPSRTVPLHVGPLSTDEVGAFLRAHAGLDAKTSARVAALGQGSIGRALGFVSDGDGRGPLEELRRQALEIVSASASAMASDAHAVALRFPPSGARALGELFTFVEEWLRDLAAVAAGVKHSAWHQDSLGHLDRLVAQANLTALQIARAFERVETARELAIANVNPQLVVGSLIRELRRALRGDVAVASA
jgi:DNA polymerase-3 subunit delta'